MRVGLVFGWVLGTVLTALASEPARFTVRLDKAAVDGGTVTLQLVTDGRTFGGAAAGVRLDGAALRGDVKSGDATYTLDAVVEGFLLKGRYAGTRGTTALGGSLSGSWTVRWTGYRGVEGEGVAEGDAPPVACDDRTGQNILWKAPVANWGHAQPVIVGDRLFVLSEGGWPAEQDLPLLQAFEAANGREAWRKTLDHLPATGLSEADQKAARDGWHNIHDRMRKAYVLFNGYICATNAAGKEAATARFKELGMEYGGWRGGGYGQLRSLRNKWNEADARAAAKAGIHPETWQYGCGMGQACVGQVFATPVTDGTDLYIATAFGAFYRVDRDGNFKWVRFDPGKPGEFCRNGRSPLLYRDLFISDMQGKLRALDRTTGEILWSGAVDDETILSPVVITCGESDVLLCFNRKAFRLPDGQPLTVEGASDFGAQAIVKSDERDVVFFCGGGEHGGWSNKGACPTPPPTAIRFRLEGEKLVGTVLWSGIEGKASGGHVSLFYYGGRLYHTPTGSAYDPLTGKRVAGTGGRDRGSSGLLPPTGHLLFLAGDRLYGLRGAGGGESNPAQTGLLACWKLDGGKLGEGTLLNAAVEGEKKRQVIEQNGYAAWMFSYSCPFTVHRGRVYVRNYDFLWCVGKSVGASVQDDPAVLHQVARATTGDALLPVLTHAGATVRHAAATRAIALPAPALKEALLKAMRGDPQPEVRAVAMRALDAAEPEAKPGSTELRDTMLKAALDSREWWKPEKVGPWETLKQVLPELGAAAEPIVIPLLAGKDEHTRWAGIACYDAAQPPASDALRDALIRTATGALGEARSLAAARLAARYRDAAPVVDTFRSLIALPEAGDEARVAMEALAAALAEAAARDAFLRAQVKDCPNVSGFNAAANLALAAKPQPTWLVDVLRERALGTRNPWQVPASAAALLGQAEPRAAAVKALKAVVAAGSFWTVRPSAAALLSLAAGGEAEALAGMNRCVGGPKGENTAWIADLLNEQAVLKDATRRAQALAILQRLLALENPDTQRRACDALAKLGADAKPAVPALKALGGHANAQLRQAATNAVARIGE